MSALVEAYDYLFIRNGDKRVHDWPLMSGPLPVLAILTVYLLFVLKIGPKFMENRKPYSLKTTLIIYNLFQIVACVLLVFGIMTNGWTTKYSVFECHPVDYSNDPMAVRLAEWCWWTTMLKLVELIETVFFVLRKKYNQVSALHVYHHVSTLTICWLGTKYVAGGMATFPTLLNSTVHILMYTYYLLALLGPEMQQKLAKFKPKLTMIQMIQFTIVLLHATQALSPTCDVPKLMAYIFVPNVVLVFYLFYDFYKKSYTAKKVN